MTTDFSCFILFLEFLLCSRILYGECRTNLLDPKAPRQTADTILSNRDNEEPRRNSNTTDTAYQMTLNNSSTLTNDLFLNRKNDKVNASAGHVEEFVTEGVRDDDDELSTTGNEYGRPAKQSRLAHSSLDHRKEDRTSVSNEDGVKSSIATSKDSKKTHEAIEEKRRDRNRKPASVEANADVSAGKPISSTEGKRPAGRNANGTASSTLSRGRLKYQVGNAITESSASKEYENGVDDGTAKAELLSELPMVKYNENNVANANGAAFPSAQRAAPSKRNENTTRLPKSTNFRYDNVGGDGYTFETRFDVDTERDFTRFEDKPSKYMINEPGNSIDKIRNFNHENSPNVKFGNIVRKPQGFTLTTPAPLDTEAFRRTVSRLAASTSQKRYSPEHPNLPATRSEVPPSTEINPNSISKNEILKKPSIKPISSFNSRRKISPGTTSVTAVAANASSENSLPTSSTVWALASLKTPHNPKIQKHSSGEGSKKDNAEITSSFTPPKMSSASTIKPFVSWSTKLQKTPAPSPKDSLTTTLKSLAEIDTETVSPIGFAENKTSATNTSVGESKQSIPPASSSTFRETFPAEGVRASANETKESYPGLTSLGHPAQDDDGIGNEFTTRNGTAANSSANSSANNASTATAAHPYPVENVRFNSSYFNYTTENRPEDNSSVVMGDENFFNGANAVDAFVSAINSPQNDEKRAENKNEETDKYDFYTVVSTTTPAPTSSEIVRSSTVVDKTTPNKFSATELFDSLETTTLRIDALANSTAGPSANVSDENTSYVFTAAAMDRHNKDGGPKNIVADSSTDAINTFENAEAHDSVSNTNATATHESNGDSKVTLDSNRVENLDDANSKSENNRTLNAGAENVDQNMATNNASMTNTLIIDNGKNVSSENGEKSDVTGVAPAHEVFHDYKDEYVTPGGIHIRNETATEDHPRDVFNTTASTPTKMEPEIQPISTTSKVIVTKFTEMTFSTMKIVSQPIASTTSTESQTQIRVDPFDETEPSDIFSTSPASISPPKTSDKPTDTDVVIKDVDTELFPKDYHFTTQSNIEKFPSNIENTLTSTSPSPESTTTSTTTSESKSNKVTDTHRPNKELPTTATFKPKLSPESVPGYLMLFFKSTSAEVCQTSSVLKENLFQFITQRSVRVQSKDQVIVVVDPEQCKEPDNSLGLIPVALYLVDDFGSYDKTLIDEMKTLLQENENYSKNYTLPIHEIIYHENIIPDNSRLIAFVVITSIAAICLVLLIFLMCTIRNRQKLNYGQRCTPVSIDDYNLDNISEYNSVRRKGKMRASKRSYGNPTFSDPSAPSKTLTYNALLKACENRRSLDEEFSQIPVITVKSEELPLGAEVKNRYANVIPLPETRVSLASNNNSVDSVTDYINANYVEGYMGAEKFYIACQAPLQNTIEDFWKMVWKEQTKVIIMLTALTENGVEKCADYLPPSEVLDCHRLFGDFQITLKKREVKEKYVISSLQLKNMVNNLWREITHLWYTSWPAQGVPSEQSSIIALLIEARAYMRNSRGAHIVHCSPGTGRTGTVIAIDVGIRDYESTRSVNIPSTVSKLRRCRAGAVQTKEQYAFIYKVLSLYAKKLHGGTALDSM